jgi:hypothetical protein
MNVMNANQPLRQHFIDQTTLRFHHIKNGTKCANYSLKNPSNYQNVMDKLAMIQQLIVPGRVLYLMLHKIINKTQFEYRIKIKF